MFSQPLSGRRTSFNRDSPLSHPVSTDPPSLSCSLSTEMGDLQYAGEGPLDACYQETPSSIDRTDRRSEIDACRNRRGTQAFPQTPRPRKHMDDGVFMCCFLSTFGFEVNTMSFHLKMVLEAAMAQGTELRLESFVLESSPWDPWDPEPVHIAWYSFFATSSTCFVPKPAWSWQLRTLCSSLK